jgi:hypothetical protein
VYGKNISAVISSQKTFAKICKNNILARKFSDEGK